MIKGGGSSAQAEAIRHALTRAFVAYEPEDRKFFKDLGTPDPRPTKKGTEKIRSQKSPPRPTMEQTIAHTLPHLSY